MGRVCRDNLDEITEPTVSISRPVDPHANLKVSDGATVITNLEIDELGLVLRDCLYAGRQNPELSFPSILCRISSGPSPLLAISTVLDRALAARSGA